MSRAYLIPIVGGIPQEGVAFQNAWGGASRIWDALFEKYIPKKHEYDSWILDSGLRLWALCLDDRLSTCERAVHLFTMDRNYVAQKHFIRMAIDLRSFDEKYPRGGFNHLPAWAAWIEQSNADAVGLHCTSVAENPWMNYNAETGEQTPKNLSEGVELYDWMDEHFKVPKKIC